MSAASAPRQTGIWRDTLVAARNAIEEAATLPQREVDAIAEVVAERLLGDFLAMAEGGSRTVFSALGNPVCSWCGAPAGPKIPAGHPQYGIFCTCNRKAAEAAEGGEPA